MSAIFSKQFDTKLRLAAVVIVLVLGATGAVMGYLLHPKQFDTGYTPVQPVAYSHKLHAGNLGVDCLYCHYTVDKSSYAAVPMTETCMNCHVRVKEKSPKLQMVRDSYATGEPIPWVKVHRLPDYVYFNHQAHVTSGVSCVSCHGRVDQMVEIRQVQPLSMAWCLDCHRNAAPNVRPTEYVTKLDWKPEGDPAELGAKLIQAKGIHPPTNCSGCHR
ncbi:cytochrome c3 family protein [Paludibaculum fermentans]|uniref:cytochrome c3 family protein n=1 Tax=Paludibaculum fermentans TaxID=1473598 RepID=UPI003EBEF1E0